MKTKSYEEYLLKTLQSPEEVLGYLNAALLDEDPKVFLLALKQVFKAQKDAMGLQIKLESKSKSK